MASAAPPNRMVSSVFITLAPPYRATVMQQQQPVLQAHSAPARDKQLAAVQVNPADSTPKFREKQDTRSPPVPHSGAEGRSRAPVGGRASGTQSPPAVQGGPGRGKLQGLNRDAAESLPPPSPALLTSYPGASSPENPLPPSAQTPPSRPHTRGQQPVYNREVETSTPPSGSKLNEHSPGIGRNDASERSKDVCGFCRKPVDPAEPVIEALNRTYHDGCFQCRSCHIPLAGKQYYNKAGIPLCEDCYQASLELCWACGEVIKDQVIRALERAYHPSCFTCTTCKQQIGEQSFAQGEVGEVYCLQDYYRKYAPMCNACNKLIIPKEDGTDSYTVECLGHSYHENCYRCEDCAIQLSPEPNEHGCYPLDGRMLCKACHLMLVSGQH